MYLDLLDPYLNSPIILNPIFNTEIPSIILSFKIYFPLLNTLVEHPSIFNLPP